MKKLFLLLAVVMFASGMSAQRTVQGIVRNDLKVSKAAVRAETPLDTTFSFQDIQFWVGDDGTQGPSSTDNRAALVLSWHDGSTTNPDNMVWGYYWPKNESRKGLDMIKAIAQADKRLLLLVQYTGSMGYTINGIGYDEDPANLDITFDYEAAKKSYSYPANAQQIADDAIALGKKNGIIEHPFNASVGSTVYDYDYWTIDRDFYPDTHWEAGWYNGYWSYFCRDAQNKAWDYSVLGASSRTLKDGTWDAWSYNGDMNNWEGSKPGYPLVAATYEPRVLLQNVAEVAAPEGKIIYADNGLQLENLKGYTVYVSTVAGNIISTFTVTTEQELKAINAFPGLYNVTAVKGNEKVSAKFFIK